MKTGETRTMRADTTRVVHASYSVRWNLGFDPERPPGLAG